MSDTTGWKRLNENTIFKTINNRTYCISKVAWKSAIKPFYRVWSARWQGPDYAKLADAKRAAHRRAEGK